MKDRYIVELILENPYDTQEWDEHIDRNNFIMYFESWDTLETIYRRIEHRITN